MQAFGLAVYLLPAAAGGARRAAVSFGTRRAAGGARAGHADAAAQLRVLFALLFAGPPRRPRRRLVWRLHRQRLARRLWGARARTVIGGALFVLAMMFATGMSLRRRRDDGGRQRSRRSGARWRARRASRRRRRAELGEPQTGGCQGRRRSAHRPERRGRAPSPRRSRSASRRRKSLPFISDGGLYAAAAELARHAAPRRRARRRRGAAHAARRSSRPSSPTSASRARSSPCGRDR